MKKFLFLSLAAVAMIVASCSTSDDVADSNIQETPGEGYVAVKIQLPSIPATRADNDKFADGTSAEYAVNDAFIYLFKGTSEATAGFIAKATLNKTESEEDIDDDNITVTHVAVGKVTTAISLGTGEHLYALAVINNATLVDPAVGTTLSGILSLTTDHPFHTGGTNFVMLNAPVSKAVGGPAGTAPTANDISYLTEINPSNIYETETEAKANPAGSIFVERAAAKVTVGVKAGLDAIASDPTNFKIGSVKWAIDNKEPKSYVLRNMSTMDYIGYASEGLATKNYRMVGYTKIGTTTLQAAVDLYRTYWCEDPQYDTDATGLVAAIAADYQVANGTNAAYCHENTFDVLRQNYKNTTRAIIKVTLEDGADFYTIAGNNTKYNESGAKDIIKGKIILNAGLKTALDAICTGSYTLDAADFNITTAYNSTTGVYSLDGMTFTASSEFGTGWSTNFSSDPAAALSTYLPTLKTEVNDLVTIYKYVGGQIYYDARFMHFASDNAIQDLAPWATWEAGKGYTAPNVGNTSVAYPNDGNGREVNYLGRYGMVRNNWYDVTINKFDKLGYPTIPSIDGSGRGDTPDDNVPEKFISVKINVLSWAKRIQGWNL